MCTRVRTRERQLCAYSTVFQCHTVRVNAAAITCQSHGDNVCLPHHTCDAQCALEQIGENRRKRREKIQEDVIRKRLPLVVGLRSRCTLRCNEAPIIVYTTSDCFAFLFARLFSHSLRQVVVFCRFADQVAPLHRYTAHHKNKLSSSELPLTRCVCSRTIVMKPLHALHIVHSFASILDLSAIDLCSVWRVVVCVSRAYGFLTSPLSAEPVQVPLANNLFILSWPLVFLLFDVALLVVVNHSTSTMPSS